jgi:hypothetical protein
MGGPGPPKVFFYLVPLYLFYLFYIADKRGRMLFSAWLYTVHVRVLEALVDTHVDGLFLYQFDTGSWSCRTVVEKGFIYMSAKTCSSS